VGRRSRSRDSRFRGLRFKKKIADRLVSRSYRPAPGPDSLLRLGAAPLSADIAKFFYSAGCRFTKAMD